jgi:hypothetical protein
VGGTRRERGALNEGAVVGTVTVIFVPELLGVTGLGESWQLACDGAPLHDRLTAWLKPPIPVAVMV